MKRVLVLCTGNSCRSIMAEALINALRGDQYHAVSAGSKPAGFVHQQALATLQRHGIEAYTLQSKSWDEFVGQAFDYVITVCDRAAQESCPHFANHPINFHWITADPAEIIGSKEKIVAAFEAAFASLKLRIEVDLP